MFLNTYHGLTLLVAMATNGIASTQQDRPGELSSAECLPRPSLTSALSPMQSLVFPVLLLNGTIQPPITLDKTSQAHLDNIEIEFTFDEKNYVARLQLNRGIRTKKYYSEEETLSEVALVELKSREACYYQGVFNNPTHVEDFVTLSTCSGLGGTLRIDGDIYSIHPLLTSAQLCQPHVITKLNSIALETCSNSASHWDSLSKLHSSEYYRLLSQSSLSSKVQRNLEQKELKLGLVADNALFALFSYNTTSLRKYLLDTVNVIDLFYQRINIRVSLVYDQIWSDRDEINVGSKVKENLNNFLRYVSAKSSALPYDVLHLLSGDNFDGMGLAVPTSICTNRAVAVISAKQHIENPQRLASVIAHMIGHNIGLEHDETDCQCESGSRVCIMGDVMGLELPSLFSSCSIDRLRLLTKVQLGRCLAGQPPPYSYTQRCGNGVIERGEQCDCGPPVACQQADLCCDPNTCLLKSWAVCRTGTCCDSCLPKPSVTQCRAATNDCDAPEYCDGMSGECPIDVAIQDGQPCADATGFCYQGMCPTHNAQCQSLWGENSNSSLPACYSLQNAVGSVLGHCGVTSEGDYRPCAKRDVSCGLLQCAGGKLRPIIKNVDYRRTSTNEYSNDLTELTCKTVNARLGSAALLLGMVHDGTKCGDQRLCQGHRCMRVDRLKAPGCFTSVDNNLTCSGNGRCTTDERCSCNRGYTGKTCETVIPTELVAVTTSRLSVTRRKQEEKNTLSKGILAVSILIPLILAIICGVVLVSYRWKKLCFMEVKKEIRTKHGGTAATMSSLDTSLMDGRRVSGQAAYYNAYRRRPRPRRHRSSSLSTSSSDEDSDDESLPCVIYHVPTTGSHIKGILKKPSLQQLDNANCECNSQCSCSASTCSSTSRQSTEQLPVAPDRIPVPDSITGQQVLVVSRQDVSDRRYSTEQHDSNSDSAIDLSKGDSGTPTPAETASISPTGRLKQSLSTNSNHQFQSSTPQTSTGLGACASDALYEDVNHDPHEPFLPASQPISDPSLTSPPREQLNEEGFNVCSARTVTGPVRLFQPLSSKTKECRNDFKTASVGKPLISNNI
ncbi:zinc metalloproteinase-disintegrin-like protein F1 isoform X2 [Watersipora subatra]|uniref:zinc metalloproteinase-disintegrin-like protein F1 isoform X2 n=1 Tax=Watersipora subatra TaxID=2589382 RepID=UPI00355C17FA